METKLLPNIAFPFLLVVVLVLFAVAAVASDFEIAVAWYFLEILAEYFGDLDNIVESAVCRLHLRVLVELAVFI